MKKVLTIFVAAVMLVCLATAAVSAEEAHYVWDFTGEVNAGEPFGNTLRHGHDQPYTSVTMFNANVSFDAIKFPRYWAKTDTVVKMDLAVIGGETVASAEFTAPGDNPEGYEFELGKTVTAGEYALHISASDGGYIFFAFASEPLSSAYIVHERGLLAFGLRTTDSGSGFDKIEVPLKEASTTEGGGIVFNDSYWLATDTDTGNHQARTFDVVVNPNAAVEGFGVNNFWVSNPANGQVSATIRISVFKFDTNYEKSVSGTPLASGEFTPAGDNNLNNAFEAAGTNCVLTNFAGTSGIIIKFNSPVEAGQYIIRFEDISQEDGNHYLVLPMTEEANNSTKAAYYLNGETPDNLTMRLVVRFAESGKLRDLVADGENPPATDPGTDPEPQPQTGDFTVAIFAFVIVLAMSAAAVVMKKRAF